MNKEIARNKFIPYGKQNVTEEDIGSVVKVLKSDFLTQGDEVPNFEKAIIKKVNSHFAVAVNSATSALHIACLALGLTKGDIVWTSPITFVASANCGRFCGAEIDFVDIDLSTALMSIPLLKKKLVEAKLKNKLPKILIVVHLTGASCDMEEIAKLSKEYNFSVIEDASHALGGRYKDSLVGSCKYSDVTVFSFHPVKIITTAEGGIATTNNFNLFKKMTEFRSHGIVRDSKEFKFLKNVPWGYEQHNLGFNYRMNDIQAALGTNQLKRLDWIIDKRNKIANRYIKKLSINNLSLLKVPNQVICSYHLAVVRLPNCNEIKYEKVFNYLRQSNIGVQLHYLPVHLHPYYRKLGFKQGDFPNSETYSKSAISIPIFPELTFKEQDFIIETLFKAKFEIIN